MGGRLVVNVAELLRRPGTQKVVELEVEAEHPWRVIDAEVPAGHPVRVEVVLESLSDGIVVSGRVDAGWVGSCRRCLEPVGGALTAEVQELYQQHPTSDEAFAFRGEQLDLGPMVEEALLLELPLAPLCRPGCAGLCAVCGADRNQRDCGHEEAGPAPRWAALQELLGPGRLDRPDA